MGSYKRAIKKHHFIFILIMSVILLYSVYQSVWWCFAFLIPLWYVYKSDMVWTRIIIYLCISLLPLIIYYFVKEYNLIEHLGLWIDRLFRWSLRDHTTNFIKLHYDQKTASFINLVMFNIKNNEAWSLYYKMIDLSIVYLIVVSGFHLSILKRLIRTILRNRVASNTISLVIILVYVYLLNFAVSVDRVFLTLIFSIVLHKVVRDRFDLLSISAMFTILLVPTSVFNLGFCMSYLCTAVIIYIYKLEIQHYLLEKIVINLSAVLVSLPFVLIMNQQISLWVVVMVWLTYRHNSYNINIGSKLFIVNERVAWGFPIRQYQY
jgi:competence protein ComEC